MPTGRETSRAWLDQQEQGDRKNGRVIDKLMLALPVELDDRQRVELVRDFARRVTEGRTPWLAAIHDRGEDTHNPHAHMLIRDKDVTTGKRVAGLSEKGSTARLRVLWAEIANQHLERAGSSARIDHRSLEAQGREQTPTIHVGPTVAAMEAKGLKPESRAQDVPGRVIDWPQIDAGRTRADRNTEISNDNTRQLELMDLGQFRREVRAADRDLAAREQIREDLDRLRQEQEAKGYQAPETGLGRAEPDPGRDTPSPEPEARPAPSQGRHGGDPVPKGRDTGRALSDAAGDMSRATDKIEASAGKVAGAVLDAATGLLGVLLGSGSKPGKQPQPEPERVKPTPQPGPKPSRPSAADELAAKARERRERLGPRPAPPEPKKEPERDRGRELDRPAYRLGAILAADTSWISRAKERLIAYSNKTGACVLAELAELSAIMHRAVYGPA